MNIQPVVIESPDKNIVELRFNGRLDGACQAQVRRSLHQTLAQASIVVVNFQEVSFMDSSGLSALVSGLRVAREHKKDIILINLPEQAQVIFRLTMMDQVFTVFASRRAALDYLA